MHTRIPGAPEHACSCCMHVTVCSSPMLVQDTAHLSTADPNVCMLATRLIEMHAHHPGPQALPLSHGLTTTVLAGCQQHHQ